MCCIVMAVAHIVSEGPIDTVAVWLHPVGHIDWNAVLPRTVYSSNVSSKVLIEHLDCILVLVWIFYFVVHSRHYIDWSISYQAKITHEPLLLILKCLINSSLCNFLYPLFSKLAFCKLIPNASCVIASSLDEPYSFNELWHGHL
jgi:hypothetical protein